MASCVLKFCLKQTAQLSCLLFFGFFALLPGNVQAQGDGPRVFLPAPVGTNALSVTWMDLASNMNFAGSILIPEANVSSTIVAVNYNRYFSLGNRLAEIWATGIAGNVDGSVTTTSLGILSADESGIADPYFALRVGLVGAPALDLATFMKTPQKIQVFALAGISLPLGDYKQSRVLNLGTNRWSLRLGLPIAIPLGSKPGATWLEIHPNMYIYGDNDAPFMASKRSQKALYMVESHLSHNFTPKFWASIDMRYQHGGETTTDGVKDNNSVDRLGGGVSAGYSFNSAWSGFFGYGQVISETDNSFLDMWRARLIFVY